MPAGVLAADVMNANPAARPSVIPPRTSNR